jgi:hypothetical protein
VTGYGPKGRGSFPGRGIRFFSLFQFPDRMWGPPRFIPNGYQGLFIPGYNGRVVMLTTHLHLVPRLRTVELYLHSPIGLHGVVLK